jgi:serine/threonine protein phosphatase PrpC
MSFLRKLFRADESDPPRDEPAEEPADEASNWWASSEADPEGAPARSQSAELSHPDPEAPPAPPDDEPQPVVDESETPTAPMSVLTEEQVRAGLAEQAASEAQTPPEGMPALVAESGESTRQLDEASAPALSARRSAQGLAAMAARDIGRVREVNQDSVFAMLTTLPRAGGDVSVGLFIVADGMGGHQGGEVASRLAVRTVVYHVLSQLVMPALDESMTEALQPLMISAVQSANEAIWDAAQLLGTDMGTTCTAALLVGHSLYIAHVGDSRAYLFEPGGLRAITADHSTVGRLIQLGQLDPSESREHPLRNQLYRTVGQQPQVMVDFIYQPVGQSSHLLLCSDGLWGMVNEPLMEQAILRSPWPQDACEELLALANLAGGEDNISAVVVSLPITER